MNLVFRAQLDVIVAAANATGRPLPQSVTRQIDRAAAHTAAIDARHEAPDALATAVLSALDGDRDPATDPEVLRILATRQLSDETLREAVANRLEEDVITELRLGADEIVHTWSAPCALAVDALRGAVAVLGNVDLTDDVSILRRGPAAPEAWARAQDAIAMLAAVDAGWVALVSTTGLVDIGRIYGALRIVDATYNQWFTHQLAGTTPDPWRYAREGLAMSLPSAADYQDRVTRVSSGPQVLVRELRRQRPRIPAGRRLAASTR